MAGDSHHGKSDCGCAPGATDETSCLVKRIVSCEEERILHQMRAVRLELRQLRQHGKADDERLKPLRARFRQLRQELGQANHDKLVALGHEV